MNDRSVGTNDTEWSQQRTTIAGSSRGYHSFEMWFHL